MVELIFLVRGKSENLSSGCCWREERVRWEKREKLVFLYIILLSSLYYFIKLQVKIKI